MVLLVLALSGCRTKEYYETPGNVIANRFIIIEGHSDNEYYIESHVIAYDAETKVIYFISTEKSGGITPLYNADGSLQIYKGAITQKEVSS